MTKYERFKIIKYKLFNWNSDELHYLEREKLEKEYHILKKELEEPFIDQNNFLTNLLKEEAKSKLKEVKNEI